MASEERVPHLFDFNAFMVLANGVDAKIGSISSRFEHFHEWKRLAEEEQGAVEMETLLKGVCEKRTFMDLFENFIVFDGSSGSQAQPSRSSPATINSLGSTERSRP